MKKINKKTEQLINKTVNDTLNNNLFNHNFDAKNTLLDFTCGQCNANYSFDIMAVYFDSLHNKEKFLINPICPYCGIRENFKSQPKTLHFLSFLYNSKNMKEAIFQENYIIDLLEKYPNEHIKDISNLDELGLIALERGNYNEVFRIFTQFIYINHHHHLGFEFISYAYYETREFDKALYFMEKAIERAEIAANNNTLEKGLLSIIKKNYEYMKRKQILFRWWENL